MNSNQDLITTTVGAAGRSTSTSWSGLNSHRAVAQRAQESTRSLEGWRREAKGGGPLMILISRAVSPLRCQITVISLSGFHSYHIFCFNRTSFRHFLDTVFIGEDLWESNRLPCGEIFLAFWQRIQGKRKKNLPVE